MEEDSANDEYLLAIVRSTALEQAVECSPLAEDGGIPDTDAVLALADKYAHWILSGETPAAQFARIETERFFKSGHPSQRGLKSPLSVVDEILGWKDPEGFPEAVKCEHPEAT